MNARNSTIVKVSLALASLAMCIAFGIFAASCANGDTGGGGNGGSTGTGGGGPSAGGSTGNGGSTGGGGTVTFADGRAQGPMTGYAFLSLGPSDTATSPVCAEDPNNPTNTRPIAGPPVGSCDAVGKTCPTTGMTVWSDKAKLCISGSIPIVVNSDYKSNWGLQIGVNTSDPPADTSGNGQTLGQVTSNAAYTSITLTTTGSVTPANTAIRTEIHLVDQTCTEYSYCASMKSGTATLLTSFNTNCWNGSTCGSTPLCTGAAGEDTTKCCKQLQASDIAKIDKIGIQISSDVTNDYAVTDFCLTGIAFGK